MAYTPITQINKSIAFQQGAAQNLAMPFLNAAGAAEDAHAWHSVTLKLQYAVNGVLFDLSSVDLIAGSTPSFSTPNTNFLLTAAQATALAGGIPPGSYQYQMAGVPVSADDPQILASGNCAVQAAP